MSYISRNLYNIERNYKAHNVCKEEELINAIKEGNALKVRSLINLGADVNFKNELGFTPLMYSAVTGIGAITKILISAGSKLETYNNDGYTALVLALFNGSYDVYDVLVKNGANKTIINNFRLSNLKLNQNEKFNVIDLIKNEVYCDGEHSKKNFTNLINTIAKSKDIRVELVMCCIALYTIESDFTGHNLKIFATNNLGTSIFTGSKLKYNYFLASYNWAKNIIQTSNADGEIASAQRLLHEFTHKIHLSCKNLSLDELNDAVKKTKYRLNSMPSNNGTMYIKENMVDRIEKFNNYNELTLKLCEYLADSISYIIVCDYYNKDKNFVDTLKYILAPIYDVFDKSIAPNLKEYLINNKNLNRLQLSDDLKKTLRQFKNVKRSKNNEYKKPHLISSKVPNIAETLEI